MTPSDKQALRKMIQELSLKRVDTPHRRYRHPLRPSLDRIKHLICTLAKNPHNRFCCWCNHPLDGFTATLEHVIPLSKGGTNALTNLALACYTCNHTRDKGANRWLRGVEQRSKATGYQPSKVREVSLF